MQKLLSIAGLALSLAALAACNSGGAGGGGDNGEEIVSLNEKMGAVYEANATDCDKLVPAVEEFAKANGPKMREAQAKLKDATPSPKQMERQGNAMVKMLEGESKTCKDKPEMVKRLEAAQKVFNPN